MPDLRTIPSPFPWDRNEEIIRRRDHYLKAKAFKAKMAERVIEPRPFAAWADRVEGKHGGSDEGRGETHAR